MQAKADHNNDDWPRFVAKSLVQYASPTYGSFVGLMGDKR